MRRPLYSPVWQADRTKTRRFAPIEFIGRHMPDFFDYAIGDEVHELNGRDAAQGNALGTLANCAGRTCPERSTAEPKAERLGRSGGEAHQTGERG